MRQPKEVTAKMLQDLDACKDQVEQFGKMFPRGAAVTKQNALRCIAAKLDLDWFAYVFLKGDSRRVYGEAIAPAGCAYDKAIRTAKRAFGKVSAYDEATGPARRAYDKAIGAAERAFDKAITAALLRGLATMEKYDVRAVETRIFSQKDNHDQDTTST